MSMLLNASEITKEELIGFRKPTRKERDRILFPKESKISSVLSFLIASLGLIIWAGGLIYMYLTISPHAAIMTFLVNIIFMTALYIILKIDVIKEHRHPSKEFELLECKVYRIRNGKAYISARNQICGDEFDIDFSDSVCKSWEFNKDMEFWLLHYTKPEESYRLIPV